MSKLGYVEKMYGNTVNIVTTNAPGNKIISNIMFNIDIPYRYMNVKSLSIISIL